MKSSLKKIVLVVFGMLLGLGVAEMGARLITPSPHSLSSRLHMAEGTLEQFEFNEEFGFFPKVGQGGEYGPYGCLANSYDPADPDGRRRLLFIGDSVTHRGRIIEGLRELYGDEDFEYWNAGVESFNTFQELELYRRYNSKLQPDHVILTFHNNDFYATPVALEEDGEIVLYQPQHPGMRSSSELFRRSALYRVALRILYSRNSKQPVDQVSRWLAELKELVEGRGARFSVIVFPVLKEPDEWSSSEVESRRHALEILQSLNIEYYDLMEGLKEGLARGIELRQDPEDTWHPGEEGGRHFARYLKDAGLLRRDP